MEMMKAKAEKEKNEAYRELRIFVEREVSSLCIQPMISPLLVSMPFNTSFFSSFNASAGALNVAGGSGAGSCSWEQKVREMNKTKAHKGKNEAT
ncbi:hypothetical protein RND71_005521 [Anisodus tanguticus]|uniref:Uncharacterized protein n=1 Tax=Anisodus tanguticus TaxID=243964 RepID=A0AAE1VV25_9SOLA|nr:hypothetical protein RND71_005521 [Anisodus tanguticus]